MFAYKLRRGLNNSAGKYDGSQLVRLVIELSSYTAPRVWISFLDGKVPLVIHIRLVVRSTTLQLALYMLTTPSHPI